MEKSKAILIASLSFSLFALLFFWIATSGISHGWYTASSEDDAGVKLSYSYGTLRYTLDVVEKNHTVTEICEYSKNNNTEGSYCTDNLQMATSGKFVLVDAIFTWIFLIPAIICLAVYTFGSQVIVLAKVTWGLGAVSFFWSIWGWIVFAILFSGVEGARPSWAFVLFFIAFVSCAIGLTLSIFGVHSGSASYETLGAPQSMEMQSVGDGSHQQGHEYDDDRHLNPNPHGDEEEFSHPV